MTLRLLRLILAAFALFCGYQAVWAAMFLD